MRSIGNFWLCLALAVFGSTALADGEDPRPGMHLMAKEVSALQKFLLSDAEFSAPKNDEAIRKSFDSLSTHLEKLDQGSFKGDAAMKANLSLLRGHVKDAQRAFKDGSKAFSRFMVQSSLQMCIACHTRHKAADFAWPEPESKDMPAIDRADYLFATRQFSKGKELYEGMVKEYPANKVSQWNLRRALLSLAIYYARITENAQGGADFFRRTSDQADLPPYLKVETSAWAKEFAGWAKEPKGKDAKESEAALLSRAKKLLRHDDFTLVSELGQSFHVRRLRASSLLHRVLEAPGEKSPAKAEALLYLGQIYPRISSNLFFRFGEMYLKACITEYPKTASARSCYVALELVVTEGFTGSAGTHIPEDEEVELLRLKRIAY